MWISLLFDYLWTEERTCVKPYLKVAIDFHFKVTSNKVATPKINVSVKQLLSQLDKLFKGDNRNTRKRCEICSKLTIKTLERR